MKPRALTVDEALRLAEMTEANLDAFEQTAPRTVAALGGRDALARISEVCCLGPMPRLDIQTWQRMCDEYEDSREHGRTGNRGEAP